MTHLSLFMWGKGTFNRGYEHVRNAASDIQKLDDDNAKVGVTGEDILKEDKRQYSKELEKEKILMELVRSRHTAQDIVRVVARNLDEPVALALEALLIKSIYGKEYLANRADGHHAERFRMINNWDYIPGYDLPLDQDEEFINESENHACGRYYVYTLRDPKDGRIFYVGKGAGDRLSHHFRNAARKDNNAVERLDEIRRLINARFTQGDIGRIVARVDTEALAFMIESFYMKFVVGFRNLHNIQPGHAFGSFRSLGDWDSRHGFDIPITVRKGEKRRDLFDSFIGEGLDLELSEVVKTLHKNYPDNGLKFGDAEIYGSGELIVSAIIPGLELVPKELVDQYRGERRRGFIKLHGPQDPEIRVAVLVRNARKFQVFAFSKRNFELTKVWYKFHFGKLKALPLNRQDEKYRPDHWHDQLGTLMATNSHKIAADRIIEMVKIARAQSREELEQLGIAYLLEPLDRVREKNNKKIK